ncbi:MAG: hypothetical protein IMF09_10475 [Proteobacteria bacterium]|nr:hypothetical protein [Pseudomonadota bacterium]
MNTNTGTQTLEWLYTHQLKVDEEWSQQTANGFRWWADKNAQAIEAIGQETASDGEVADYICVRTEMLRSVVLNDNALEIINDQLMSVASMGGPVYDPKTRTLSLCSLVRVYADIRPWMQNLISSASVLQIGEAREQGPRLALALDAELAISGHAENGIRPEPDELASIIQQLVIPMGVSPCSWNAEDFLGIGKKYLNRPPSLMGNADSSGFIVEFPYGNQSSLCQVLGNQPHPLYGNGLLQLQRFPLPELNHIDGIKLALIMNENELTRKPLGYGFGSYAYRNGILYFNSFTPNMCAAQLSLENMYFSCGQRAREISKRFTGNDWSEETFSPGKSALGRMMDSEQLVTELIGNWSC